MAPSPLLGIRLKFRAMAEMFLSFPKTLFIMQKSAVQPSISGCDSCLAGLGIPLGARADELPGRGHGAPQPAPVEEHRARQALQASSHHWVDGTA